MNLRDLTIGGTAGTALTAAALSFPWSPKPPPTPTVSVPVPVSFYTEERDGVLVGAWYAHGEGYYDLKTGAAIPMTPDEQQWVDWMATMYGTFQNPRYLITGACPLPKPEGLVGQVLTINGVEYVVKDGKWVEK